MADEILDFGNYQMLQITKGNFNINMTIRGDQLCIVDFPHDCISGTGLKYGNFFYRELYDHCIDCEETTVFEGTYIGEVNVTASSFPSYSFLDTIVVVSHSTNMSCMLELQGLFDGMFHLSGNYVIENFPTQSAHFSGDTLFYTKLFWNGQNNYYYFTGLKQP